MAISIADAVNQLFRFADRNRNGRLEAGGLGQAPRAGARAQGGIPDETRLPLPDRLALSAAARAKGFAIPGGDLARFVPLADANRDGALSRREAEDYLIRFDQDGDFHLSDAEIRDGLRQAAAGTLR